MTREEAKELLPVIKAFAEGKEIQYRNSFNEWFDIKKNEGLSFIKTPLDYRIKPESQYRPFKTQEECWNEMLKHNPFGWVKRNDTGAFAHISAVFPDLILFDRYKYNYEESLDRYTFIDGEPFGIKN